MNLEITKDERILILRCLFAETPLHDPEVKALANRLMELRDGNGHGVPVSVGAVPGPAQPGRSAQGPVVPSAGARSPQQLPDSVHERRTESGSQPQRAAQVAEIVRWSSSKFDRESVEQITVTPAACKRKDVIKTGEPPIPRMEVSWPARGRGYLYAAVWDEALFGWVAGRVKQETVFYVLHKGKYTNIVGVKA